MIPFELIIMAVLFIGLALLEKKREKSILTAILPTCLRTYFTCRTPRWRVHDLGWSRCGISCTDHLVRLEKT